MRIVHLIDSLYCAGAEQVVASLAAYQSKRGHSVRVVCLRDFSEHPVDVPALLEAGVQIVTLGKPPGFHFGTLRKLTRYLKDERIEVVHTHNHLVHHYGVAAARWASAPVVLNTLHGSSSFMRTAFWAKALFWFSCLISDGVVAVCQEVQTVFRAAFPLPARKNFVVDNGINLSRFLAVSRSPRSETVTYGNIARLDPIKDHANLFKAFAILRKKYSHVQLRLLGEGTLRQELEELARSLSIGDAVHMEGFSLDTARFLNKIDVYVISSRSEGLPLTLLEAMGAALPIVSTAVGSVPDIIGKAHCGWLCPPSNPEALAKAMEQAIQAPDLAAIGARSRKTVEEYYSVERMNREYECIYEALLAG